MRTNTARAGVLVFVLALFASGDSLPAVELAHGGTYPAGTRIEASDFGLSLTVPSGWLGEFPPGAEALVLGSTELESYIFVNVDRVDLTGGRALMSQTLPLGAGVSLTPISEIRQSGDFLLGIYGVSGGNQPMSGFVAARVGKNGFTASFIAVSVPRTAKEVRNITLALAHGATLAAPSAARPPATSATGEGGTAWETYMLGRHVVRYVTRSDYREEYHVYLCSDRSFHESNQSGGFGGGASGVVQGSSSGRWSASGSTLSQPGTLMLDYGAAPTTSRSETSFGDWTETSPGRGRTTHTLSLVNDKLYIDGQQWLRAGNDVCQ